MVSSRFVVVRGTAAFQENPRIPREKYPRRPTPFILSMRSTIIRISLRSRPSGTLDLIDNLVKCAKRNIFFACLMRMGRYYKPRVYCYEKRGIAGNLEEQKNAPRRENVPRAPRQNHGGGMEKWWAKVKRGRWGREGRWCTINFEASRREGRASVWICMQEQLATPPCGLAPR